VPQIREWLGLRLSRPELLVEPFAGGGIVTLTAVAENLVDQAIMVELDQQVASVWQTILGSDCEWLMQQIDEFHPSVDTVSELMSVAPASTRDMAFQTIVKNRTYYGGIIAAGSSPLKRGDNDKGVASRWYPSTLNKRIGAIYELRDRITVINGDGLRVTQTLASSSNTAFFIDPPYVTSGRRLYTHYAVDHALVFSVAAQIQGDFLITYDDADSIRELAAGHGFNVSEINMRTRQSVSKKELLITR
jgi:DNA adenine methylase